VQRNKMNWALCAAVVGLCFTELCEASSFFEDFEPQNGTSAAPFYRSQTTSFPDPGSVLAFLTNTDGLNSWAGEDSGAVTHVGINDNADSQGFGIPNNGFHGTQGAFLVRDIADESEAGGFCGYTTAFPADQGGPGYSGLPTQVKDTTVHVDMAFQARSSPMISEFDFAIEVGVSEADGDEFVAAWVVTLTKQLQTYNMPLNAQTLSIDYDDGIPQNPGGGVLGDSEVAGLYLNFYDPLPPAQLDSVVFFLDDFRVVPESANLPGDTNNDGVVDAADYIALKENFGTTGGASLGQGDLNGDKDVNWLDLQILMSNFGTRSVGGAPPVPEPATLSLLALGGLALARCRRK